MANVCEVTVVVGEGHDTASIRAEVDAKIGIAHDRHYPYAGNRDVVYTVPEEDVDRVGEILDAAPAVMAYDVGDPVYQEEESPLEPEGAGDDGKDSRLSE